MSLYKIFRDVLLGGEALQNLIDFTNRPNVYRYQLITEKCDKFHDVAHQLHWEWTKACLTVVPLYGHDCSFCARSMATGVLTACKHRFHPDCLVAWMKFSEKCPFCHLPLRSEDNKFLATMIAKLDGVNAVLKRRVSLDEFYVQRGDVIQLLLKDMRSSLVSILTIVKHLDKTLVLKLCIEEINHLTDNTQLHRFVRDTKTFMHDKKLERMQTETGTCGVCSIGPVEGLTKLPCSHTFHSTCLDLRERCPVCGSDVGGHTFEMIMLTDYVHSLERRLSLLGDLVEVGFHDMFFELLELIKEDVERINLKKSKM